MKRDLQALQLNPVLSRIADKYCEQMVADGFFGHIHPTTGDSLGQRAINGGYVFLAVAENLSRGPTKPADVIAEWLSSNEGHREEMLRPQWQEVGISVCRNDEGQFYWVVEFGNPP